MRRRAERVKIPHSEYVLSQKIVCGTCGTVFVRRSGKSGFVTWGCRKHDRKASSCPIGRIPEAEIYAAFVRMYNKLKQNEGIVLKPVLRQLEDLNTALQRDNPAIIEAGEFDTVQTLIQGKTAGYATTKDRPALHLKPHLRCACCAGELHRLAGKNRRADTLYLKCIRCGSLVTIPDAALLEEVSRQIAEHERPADEAYSPSAEVVRLTNAINRGLESPDEPESLIDLILQGASARYDYCPDSTKDNPSNRPAGVDLKCFGQATRTGLVVSHITISAENAVTVCFK